MRNLRSNLPLETRMEYCLTCATNCATFDCGSAMTIGYWPVAEAEHEAPAPPPVSPARQRR